MSAPWGLGDLIAVRYRHREQCRAWLHEFDCWIELRHDEEEAWAAAGQWSESVATADARTRRIRLYGPIGCAIDALAVVAHEVGHIALNHRGRRPSYVQEFEAEKFAKALLERDGYRLPRWVERRERAYVRGHIYRGLRHGLRSVDQRIARWAMVGSNVPLPSAASRQPARDFCREARQRVRAALGGAP
jgi:hypothetical protein